MPSPADREKALESALAQIDRQFGKGSVMRLGSDERAPVEVIPTGSIALDVALGQFGSASAFVITDISRDGMLEGPDVEGLAAAVAATSVPVIASGGVSSLDDIAALDAIDGLHGIITGRALYERRFTVAEAVAVLTGGAAP